MGEKERKGGGERSTRRSDPILPRLNTNPPTEPFPPPSLNQRWENYHPSPCARCTLCHKLLCHVFLWFLLALVKYQRTLALYSLQATLSVNDISVTL